MSSESGESRGGGQISLILAARGLDAEAAARKVLPALADCGVDFIVLKGPALAAWLYRGEELRRSFGDLDLLVPPERWEAAGECLEALGYERGGVGWDELSASWRREDQRLAIDVHRSLVGAAAEPRLVWHVLSARCETREMLGIQLRCLDQAGLAMHVATHAAQHGLDGGSKPMEDLRRALAQTDAETWRAARELARSIEAEPAFAAGLRRRPAGRRLAEELGLSTEMPLDIALRAADEPPSLVLGLEQLGRLDGRRRQASFALTKVFPPAAQMRSTSSLARRGRPGLLAAWAMRPVLTVVRLPGALRRHRALSREGERSQQMNHDQLREPDGR